MKRKQLQLALEKTPMFAFCGYQMFLPQQQPEFRAATGPAFQFAGNLNKAV
ncbi:hypothetical protein [Paraburkholderia sp. J8-2]|uniref:hypothetical protein n=1 Tax=Paraburkholderia sp. J8-2 TaxID=2805440 RepID=UPI002AB6F2D8|nr:hypothetical protein [Paraburkholderia sp. J8-2]